MVRDNQLPLLSEQHHHDPITYCYGMSCKISCEFLAFILFATPPLLRNRRIHPGTVLKVMQRTRKGKQGAAYIPFLKGSPTRDLKYAIVGE